jgi:hypothetical protein
MGFGDYLPAMGPIRNEGYSLLLSEARTRKGVVDRSATWRVLKLPPHILTRFATYRSFRSVVLGFRPSPTAPVKDSYGESSPNNAPTEEARCAIGAAGLNVRCPSAWFAVIGAPDAAARPKDVLVRGSQGVHRAPSPDCRDTREGTASDRAQRQHGRGKR